MKKTAIPLIFGLLLGCSTQQSRSTPAKESATDALFVRLFSDDKKVAVDAYIELVRLGEPLLPQLISRLNSAEYISPGKTDSEKFSDPRWQRRMRLAGIIQDIAKQDFLVRATVYGNPDIPFKMINDWWKQRQ